MFDCANERNKITDTGENSNGLYKQPINFKPYLWKLGKIMATLFWFLYFDYL